MSMSHRHPHNIHNAMQVATTHQQSSFQLEAPSQPPVQPVQSTTLTTPTTPAEPPTHQAQLAQPDQTTEPPYIN